MHLEMTEELSWKCDQNLFKILKSEQINSIITVGKNYEISTCFDSEQQRTKRRESEMSMKTKMQSKNIKALRKFVKAGKG